MKMGNTLCTISPIPLLYVILSIFVMCDINFCINFHILYIFKMERFYIHLTIIFTRCRISIVTDFCYNFSKMRFVWTKRLQRPVAVT